MAVSTGRASRCGAVNGYRHERLGVVELEGCVYETGRCSSAGMKQRKYLQLCAWVGVGGKTGVVGIAGQLFVSEG